MTIDLHIQRRWALFDNFLDHSVHVCFECLIGMSDDLFQDRVDAAFQHIVLRPMNYEDHAPYLFLRVSIQEIVNDGWNF